MWTQVSVTMATVMLAFGMLGCVLEGVRTPVIRDEVYLAAPAALETPPAVSRASHADGPS